MASLNHRRKCADHQSCSSSITPRRFLKVISDNTSRDTKLGIPKSFLDIHGDDLSNRVYFKLPCGSEREIGLTSYNGDEVWFRKGWPEFSKLYSLQKGHSLVFEYQGDSRFQVSIFDGRSNMEIDYKTSMLGSEEGDQDDDISLEILEDVRPTALPRKKNRTVLSPKAEINVSYEKPVKKETHWSNMRGKNDFLARRNGEGTSRKQTRIVGRVKCYKCSFETPMHNTYMKQNLMWLPKRFVQTHLRKQPRYAILKFAGGRKTWPVKLMYGDKRGRVKFQCGWTEFLRSTNIKVGDLCEFILIDSNILVLEVKIKTVNRTLSPDIDDEDEDDDDKDEDEDEDEDTEDSDDESLEILDQFPPNLKRKEKSSFASHVRKKMKPISSTQEFPEGRPEVPRKIHHHVTAGSGKDKALQRANDFKSPDPVFKISLHPSYILGHYLWVPSSFARRYLAKQPSDVILRVASKRTWSVNVCYAGRRTTFRTRWTQFAQDNHLKNGDACVFMLTDKIKFLFDVEIFRAHRSLKVTSSPAST